MYDRNICSVIGALDCDQLFAGGRIDHLFGGP
ncbi:hypothetical protein C5S35_01070, partial [Candidatus Methanophagaceae archaeon]